MTSILYMTEILITWTAYPSREPGFTLQIFGGFRVGDLFSFGVVLIVLCLVSNVTWLCELTILDCQFIFLCRLLKDRGISATGTERNNTFKSPTHCCWRRCRTIFFFIRNRKGTTKYQNSDLVYCEWLTVMIYKQQSTFLNSTCNQ